MIKLIKIFFIVFVVIMTITLFSAVCFFYTQNEKLEKIQTILNGRVK